VIPASEPEQPPAFEPASQTESDTDSQLPSHVSTGRAPSRNGGRHVVWFKWKSSLIASGLVAAALLSAIGWLRSGQNSTGDRAPTAAAAVQTKTPELSAAPATLLPAPLPAPQRPETSDLITSPQPPPVSVPVQKNTVPTTASPNVSAVNLSPKSSAAEPAPNARPDPPPPSIVKQPDTPLPPPPSVAHEIVQPAAPVSRPPEEPTTNRVASGPQSPQIIATGQTPPTAVLSRVVGSWTYSSNGIYQGSEPEIAEMAVRNDNGYIIGTLAIRFKSASKGEIEPLLRFAFGGDLHNAARPTFNLESKDGGKGTIELIPGAAPNRLEVNFQAGREPGKALSADIVLDKRAGPSDRESAAKNQLASGAPPVQQPPQTQRAAAAVAVPPALTPSRLTGAWSYPAMRTDGVEPELFEMAIRNDNGYMIGTLSMRFKSPSRAASEPLLHFAFSGELPNGAHPTFKLDSREGGHGSIELIPGTAPNLLEVKFQAEEADRENHSGNIVLVKRVTSTVANAVPRP